MKNLIVLFFLLPIFLHAQQQRVSSAELSAAIRQGKGVACRDAIIEGDLIFGPMPKQVKAGNYGRRGGVEVQILANQIYTPVSFFNCRFEGKVIAFAPVSTGPKNVVEYSTHFQDTLSFVNCVFEQEVTFELNRFNGPTSFAGSIFKQAIDLKMAGYYLLPDLSGTRFEGKVNGFAAENR